MQNLSLIQSIIVWAIPVIFGITLHEVSHGWVANKLGDPTAKMLGRLTVNPIKHIDPIGTILIPGLLLVLKTGFIFGWAKPVPVDWRNLRNPRRDMALVAVAGPISNLLMAIFWAGMAKIGLLMGGPNESSLALFLTYSGAAGIMINLVLGILNLLPLPPLDGSRVLSSFLSPKAAYYFNQLERFGFIILVLLLVLGVLGKIISPIFLFCLSIILGLFNIPIQIFM